jgi:hypothetical protein
MIDDLFRRGYFLLQHLKAVEDNIDLTAMKFCSTLGMRLRSV